jgi:hypothetical protein
MLNAAPNETETPHQQKIRLQNERRRRQSEQRQQEHEQQRLEQQEHAVVMQMPIALRSIHWLQDMIVEAEVLYVLLAEQRCGCKKEFRKVR